MNEEYENCGDLDELIQKVEQEMPDGRTKDYKIWMERINHLYLKYNKLVKFKCYKMLK